MQTFLLSVLCLTALARSSPLPQTKRSCQEYEFVVNTTSLNLKWAIDPIENNEDVVGFLANAGRRDHESVFHPLTLPTAPEKGMYTISGTFCQPPNGGNGTVLIATHGGGYDR